MSFPYYAGDPAKRRQNGPAILPGSRRERQTDPAGYLPDPGLVQAVNVALLLAQPLLLTGDPGTGKTQLAYNLAWELGFDPPLIFETKSNSTSRELFYTYDAVQHFRAVQTGAAKQAVDFITWNALGLAIPRSREAHEVQDLLPAGFEHGGKRRSVVLIDEIDKAPRDFPNDLLNEIENKYFRVPELENRRIDAAEELPPILVLTSNSEKSLPDAFLRRCIFYHIPPPDRDRLVEIVAARLGGFKKEGHPMLSDALDLYFRFGWTQTTCARNPPPRNCWDGWKPCGKWARRPMNRCCCNLSLFSNRSARWSKARKTRPRHSALSKRGGSSEAFNAGESRTLEVMHFEIQSNDPLYITTG